MRRDLPIFQHSKDLRPTSQSKLADKADQDQYFCLRPLWLLLYEVYVYTALLGTGQDPPTKTISGAAAEAVKPHE